MSPVQTRTLNVDDQGEAVTLTYQFHPHHRNNNPNKSQWIVPIDSEFESFRLTIDQSWTEGHSAWGLCIQSAAVQFLGIDCDRQTELFIAKFVCDASRPEWHGYPANHVRNEDRPSLTVLNKWLQSGTLPTAKVSKITQGKPCKP